ncbi:inositol monophosphatase family protein [Niallia sp. 03133]|uniref:inositol monophosphatase family protein n=1 Tax=Niallia sp. 03133 TaxID=3458060 RepID=UPI004043C620
MIQTLKKYAEQIAVDAGKWIVQNRSNMDKIQYKKNHLDLVTDIDRLSEERITRKILEIFPEHAIISEETQSIHKDFTSLDRDEYCWIVDPIDGTVNYVHDIPYYSISIGIVKNGKPIVGVVYDPNRDELFSAGQGLGAYVNGKKLQVSSRSLKESVLHTGYCASDWTTTSPLRHEFAKCYAKSRNIKIAGSASLDLAYVACGRIDGFWQRGLSPWDIAAGILLVTEAGGTVSGVDGSVLDLKTGDVMATNGSIQQQLKTILSEVDEDERTISI